MEQRGKNAAIWKFVYIAEAHAMDEWPLRSGRFNQGRGAVIVEEQPTSATGRCALAEKFTADFLQGETGGVELLVDNPETGDLFEKAYAPWPLRLFLVKGGTMEWIAQPKDCSYDESVGQLMRLLQLEYTCRRGDDAGYREVVGMPKRK